MSLSLSIIIPAHNERHFLPGLLNSLRPLMKTAAAEIIVLDNGSTDGTRDIVAAYPCRYVTAPLKVNPSAARNLGVKASSGRFLAFLDADVVVTPGWIEELHARLPDIAAEPMLLMGDQYHISSSPSWIERFWFQPLRAQPKRYINGGNIVTSRVLFDTIGGFDESLETGEDVDFCERAIRAGGRVAFDSKFVTLHEGFPKTVLHFVRRERWHGTSDFERLGKLVKSKIAVMTLLFLALHIALIASSIAAFAGQPSARVALLSAAGIAILCFLSSVYRFSGAGIRQLLAGTVMSYLYFTGRCLSFLQVMRRKVRAAPPGKAGR